MGVRPASSVDGATRGRTAGRLPQRGRTSREPPPRVRQAMSSLAIPELSRCAGRAEGRDLEGQALEPLAHTPSSRRPGLRDLAALHTLNRLRSGWLNSFSCHRSRLPSDNTASASNAFAIGRRNHSSTTLSAAPQEAAVIHESIHSCPIAGRLSGPGDWLNARALRQQVLRIVEVLPEVSTMVSYNAVWVATPATDEDEQAADAAWRVPDPRGRVRV